MILGACEILSALVNGPRDGLPENATAWIAAQKHLEVRPLIPEAGAMLDRLLGENPELNELWRENEANYPTWKSGVEDLRRRLTGQ